jgi:hypothetical protein
MFVNQIAASTEHILWNIAFNLLHNQGTNHFTPMRVVTINLTRGSGLIVHPQTTLRLAERQNRYVSSV